MEDYKKGEAEDDFYVNMHEILPNLWLGNLEASLDSKTLTEKKISNVLSILARHSEEVQGANHLRLTMRDGTPYRHEQLLAGIKFIKGALDRGEGVLVHCMAGVSRSSTMVAAYLMRELNYNPWKAITHLKGIRQIVDPAFETFTSAVEWVFPNRILTCQKCGKFWEYIEDYAFISREQLDNICRCSIPLLDV